ncbi:MAG: FdtA/QdtA family cupin domain-containing protein [Gammaproteobacteria bacterium]|nr:FdtA/QdtA family cupin domain-containing protein [Gammaproteobacteria bacterium]
MARLINIDTHSDDRGSLCVIEKNLPFDIRRVYYMFDVTSKRGGHRHKKTIQALIALNGSCEVFIENENEKKTFVLASKTKCLILDPEDWHTMDNFSDGTILLVLSSEFYDKNDYIEEGY